MPIKSEDKITETDDIQPILNIYEKIQLAKIKLSNENIKKSGYNKFSDFQYYELSDFMPSIIKIFDELKLFSKVTFTSESAVLKIINTENPAEYEEYTSPMKDLVIKGSNAMQELGGVETYQRRYLYMSALDITENDLFDNDTVGKDTEENKPVTPKISDKKATDKQMKLLYSIIDDIVKGYAAVEKAVAPEAVIKRMTETLKLDKSVRELSAKEASSAIDYLTKIKLNVPKQDSRAG
jgi:hypothetical protein